MAIALWDRERRGEIQILIKAVVSLIIIFTATGIAKKFPSIAGLIAVMPLTGVLVLLWSILKAAAT